MLRTGFLALRRIADYFGIAYDPDPRPDDPITVSRREFDLLCVELEAAAVPLKPDRDQAWRDFAGWRVNYDEVLVALCALTMAPPAKWSSDRLTARRPHAEGPPEDRPALVTVIRCRRRPERPTATGRTRPSRAGTAPRCPTAGPAPAGA